MPTTTIQDLGFVEVAGTLEPGAIAGEIARDAHNRVGESSRSSTTGFALQARS